MALLSGLGRGLGAAASGYLGGQIKGEAEVYRRGKAEEDRALKKYLADLKKKEIDTRKPQVDAAKSLFDDIGKKITDPKLLRFLKRSEEYSRKVGKMTPHLVNVLRGEEDLSPNILVDWLSFQQAAAADTGEEPVAPGPGGAPEIPAEGPPSEASWLSRVPTPMTGQGPSAFPAIPRTIGPPVPPGMGRQPALPGMPRPPAAPAPAPPAPPPPAARPAGPAVSPRVRAYHEHLDKRPVIYQDPDETDPEFRDREKQMMAEWKEVADALKAGLSAADEAAIKKIDAQKAAIELPLHERVVTTGIQGRRATARAATAQAETLERTLPGKVEKGGVDVAKGKQALKQAPKDQELRERGVRAQEQNARTSAGQLKVAQDRENRLLAEGQKKLGVEAKNDYERGLKERVSRSMRIIEAYQNEGFAGGRPKYDPPRIQAAKAQLTKDLAALDKVQAGRTATTAPTLGGGGAEQTRTINGEQVTRSEFIRRARAAKLSDEAIRRATAKAGFR